jgi:hypothetical protein
LRLRQSCVEESGRKNGALTILEHDEHCVWECLDTEDSGIWL